MKDIDEIKNRINRRKKSVLTDSHFKKFYNFMIKCMVVLVLMISIGSVVKDSPNGVYIKKYFLDVFSLSKIENYFFGLFQQPDNTTAVSNEVFYSHLEDNYYTSNSNEGMSLSDGIVVEKGNSPMLGNYITVLNDDLSVTYGQLEDVFVNQYDEVDKNMVIGTYSEKILIVFSKGDKEIDYSTFEEYCK